MTPPRRAKRVVAIGDLHSGHAAGLTPPSWWASRKREGWQTIRKLQAAYWREYCRLVALYSPCDLLIVNGDGIDGKGERSGGTELLTSDRREQVDMASACIKPWRAAKICMTYGTGYHVGREEDWEHILADKVGADIRSHLWVDINGCTFDVKHKVGSSSIPHGRYTALARSRLWNMLWAARKLQPAARVVLRSHVHYHAHCGDAHGVAMTLPALQAAHTKYGARECEGTVDWGIVVFDIAADGGMTWKAETYDAAALAESALIV